MMRAKTILASLLVISSCVDFANGENILFFWAVSGYSHRITVWPLVEGLVARGHNVTFFSPLPSRNPNPKVHEMVVENLLRDAVVGVDFVGARVAGGAPAISKIWSTYFEFAIKSCEVMVQSPELVDWINNSKYDLVIMNGMFNDCAYSLVHKFQAPHIIYGTTHTFGWWSESFGYPDENFPEFQFHFPENMNFFQSVRNAVQPLYWQWSRLYYMFPKLEKILRDGLNMPDMPPFADIERNVSLVFMNTHFSEEYARSLPPLFVQIGGMHCTDQIKPLAEGIETFINLSDTGFIYFSFGTFANVEKLPQRIVSSIFYAMGNTTTVQFLAKWTDESITGMVLPKNIKLVKWISQQDVLGHPKIRAFISHGGLLGTQEAVYHGVPTIVIPLFAEQDYNAERIQMRRRGVIVDIGNLTQNNLMSAIREILGNNVYAENIRKVSKLFRDRPMKPVDTALWWVEYVMRHKDSRHLQPIGLKRSWLERRMLDIWLFLVGCGIISLIIIWTILRKIRKLVFLRDTAKSKED